MTLHALPTALSHMVHRSMASNVISLRFCGRLGRLETRLFPSTGFHRRSCRGFSNFAPANGIYSQPPTSVSIGVLPSYPPRLSGPVSSFSPGMISTVHSHTSNGLSQRLSTSMWIWICSETSRCSIISFPISRGRDP